MSRFPGLAILACCTMQASSIVFYTCALGTTTATPGPQTNFALAQGLTDPPYHNVHASAFANVTEPTPENISIEAASAAFQDPSCVPRPQPPASASGQAIVNHSDATAGPVRSPVTLFAIPEPSAYALIFSGLAALAIVRRRMAKPESAQKPRMRKSRSLQISAVAIATMQVILFAPSRLQAAAYNLTISAAPAQQGILQGNDGTVTFTVTNTESFSVQIDSLGTPAGIIPMVVTPETKDGDTCGTGADCIYHVKIDAASTTCKPTTPGMPGTILAPNGLGTCTEVLDFSTIDYRNPDKEKMGPDYGLWYVESYGFTSHEVGNANIAGYDILSALVAVEDPGSPNPFATPEPCTYALIFSGLAAWALASKLKGNR